MFILSSPERKEGWLSTCPWLRLGYRGESPNECDEAVVIPVGRTNVTEGDHALLVENERGRDAVARKTVRGSLRQSVDRRG